MTTTRWFRNFGSGRGAPRRPSLALALAALSGLALGGCSTLGNNGCSSCGEGPLSRLRSGLATMRTGGGGCSSCGGGGCSSCGGGGGLLRGHKWFGGRSAEVVEPGVGVGVPIGTAPGAVIPGPGPAALPGPAVTPGPADSAPAEEVPGYLEKTPEPSGSGGTSPETRNSSGAVKSVYETTQPPRVGVNPTRRDTARPAPSPESSAVDDVLSELPPITATVGGGALPEEAPPKQPEAPVAAGPDVAPPPARPAGGLSVGAGAGIRRFKVVEPRLAGGSLPSADGWAWLAEKGYKTVLDLRERSEARPEDFAAIDRNGLIHVGLPITAATLDEKAVEKFDALLAQAGARPLFFFDTDGSRVSALWYIHRVLSGEVDPKEAAREAEEMGERDPKVWVAATALLAKLKPAPADAAPEPTVASPPPANPRADNPPAPPPQPQASVEPKVAEAASPAAIPTEPTPEPARSPDPAAWKPYVAVVLTGLTIPLAFIGRSALFHLGAAARASLPAPERRSRSLPGASGG